MNKNIKNGYLLFSTKVSSEIELQTNVRKITIKAGFMVRVTNWIGFSRLSDYSSIKMHFYKVCIFIMISSKWFANIVQVTMWENKIYLFYGVVYFNRRLGAAHFKRWLKSFFSMVWC